MTNNATICVGTLGQGIWRSSDSGDTWLRVRHGLYSESAVRALAVHPNDPRILYCGADSGIYRSEDKGEHWEWLDSPMNQLPVWALAIDPVDPNNIFAGPRPAGDCPGGGPGRPSAHLGRPCSRRRAAQQGRRQYVGGRYQWCH